MPSPSTRRLAFGLDLGPSGTYSCVPHLAPLSAGFGASCTGVTGVSLRSLPLYRMYYRYISGSALWESPREREVRARTPLNVTQVLPYGQSRVPRNLRQDAS